MTPAPDPQVVAALAGADVVPAAISLVHLTGDEALLERIAPHVRGPWDYAHEVPPDLAHEIRTRLAEALAEPARGAQPLPPRETLQKMMRVAAGEPVSDAYAPMMLEELALDGQDARAAAWRAPPDPAALADFNVAVIGAGMSGLCAAIKLREAGIAFTAFEKNDTVGGTWLENRYPGCGVDSPNHFYSYSFDPNHDWPEFYSKRDELWRYFERCADRYDVRRSIRFATEVVAAAFDARVGRWHLTVRDRDGREERSTFNAIVCAVGQLNRPALPRIDGLSDFAGPVVHTAQWHAGFDVKGKRVAMIGTGASGMQTGPAIAPEVKRLAIFQRSPHWVVANPNYHRLVSDEKKWVLQHVPYYARWYRFQLFWGFGDGLHAALQKDPAWHTPERSLNEVNERHRRFMLRHMERELEGRPDLLAKATPDYPPYGKRILIDNHWFRMLRRDNVDLITEPIERITRDAVRTRDGHAVRADVIVAATGFSASKMLAPMDIRGRGGAVLRELWGQDDPRAYLGITLPRFPNLFLLYGPNTNLGHGGSIIFHVECQLRYTMQCLRELIENRWSSIECRQDVHDAYNARLDAAHARMVWTHPGMKNWYRNARGRVTQNSPWRLVDYWAMTKEPRLDDFIVRSDRT